MEDATIIIHTKPDAQGNQSFTLTWTEPNGVFRPELAPDGEVVGYRRGQCFHANLGERLISGRWGSVQIIKDKGV